MDDILYNFKEKLDQMDVWGREGIIVDDFMHVHMHNDLVASVIL